MSKKKLLAMLTGMVMAFMGLAGVGAASANSEVIPPRAAMPEKASLTVHKYLGATTSLKHDGTAITDGSLTGKTALAGVKFNLYKVNNVDISTNAGLELATKLAKVTLDSTVVTTGIKLGSDTYTLSAANPPSAVTGSDGTAKFENKERGLYVVVEDLEGSTGIDAKLKPKITPIAPFAVTLPMTNPDGKAWNSDVHVYPKNQENELDKKVKDMGVTKGENFTYILSSTSTGADTNGDKSIDRKDIGGVYEFYDELPANVTYVSTTATIDGNATQDFDVTGVDKTKTGNKITVAFKEAALDTIAKGAKVEVTITVTLTDIPADGITKNKARLYPNDWSKKEGKDTPIESPEVETKHGDIVIKKVDESGTKPLSGAVFAVHLADTVTKSCSDLTKLGPVIKTSEATGTDGLVSIKGLQLTNFINGEKVADKDQVPYCLVETKAPDGFQLLPKAIEFKLTKAGMVKDLAGAIDANAGNATTIKNYKNPGLPLTGAQGILLVSVLGLILVSVGVVLTVKRRKD